MTLVSKFSPIGVILAMLALAGPVSAADSARSERPRLGLALSGGGARGFAHIGVLRVLRDNGIVPDYVTGTSMGSIIGGLYALGYSPEELEELITEVDWQAIFSNDPDRRSLFFQQKDGTSRYLVNFVLDGLSIILPSSISRGDKITNLFTLATLGAPSSFDEFPIPFRAVATDIVTGAEVILDGKRLTLAEAMRASMAIPGAIEPVDIDDQLLVDGMMVKNLPVDIAIGMGATRIIAVDISNPLLGKDELVSILAVADQAFSLQIAKSTEEQRKLADLVIIPELDGFSVGDFDRAAELIAAGEAAARKQIDAIRAVAAVGIGGAAVPLQASPRADPDHELRIDAVEITGDADPRDLALLHSLGIRRGARLTSKDLDQRIRGIFGQDFLNSIRVATRRNDQGGYILKLHVERRNANSIGIGLHYDELYQTVGLVNWTTNGLIGPRSVLSADFLFGGIYGTEVTYLQYNLGGSAFFVQPRLFMREQKQPLFANKRHIKNLRDRYWGAEMGIGRALRNFGQVVGGYRWKRVDFGDRQVGIDADDNVSSLFVRSELDTLDAFPFATEGTLLKIRAEVADRLLGGDASFWRASLRAAHYYRLADRHTVSADLRASSSLGSRLPVYEEFLLGGPTSFPGFERQELRGSNLIALRLAYQYRLFDLPLGLGRGAYGTLAYNVGTIGRSRQQLTDDSRLEHGGAVGIGLDTIVLPVEITLGFGSNDRVEAYVSIGFPLARETPD